MKEINELQFKHKLSVEFLPTESLFGVKTVNCEVLCKDKEYRPLGGIELGFIFFTITYVKLLG
tara:strand:+ start:23683 stop:23871 length:189 start_codon:yes stop_codon:yes gene_type:complete